MEHSKENYIKYRLEKAEETLFAAKVLIENRLWNSVINRLYYACFYAINALLVSNNISAKTHNGVKTQFFLNFIKTGLIDKKYSLLYSDLFDWRQKGDYNDFFDFKEEDVLPLFEPCNELINTIKTLIRRQTF